MNRIHLLLALMVIATALYLVGVQYESRKLTVQIYKAQDEARKLELEQQRLHVEKRARATPLRVETIARQKLAMQNPSPGMTHYWNASKKGEPDTAVGGLP